MQDYRPYSHIKNLGVTGSSGFSSYKITVWIHTPGTKIFTSDGGSITGGIKTYKLTSGSTGSTDPFELQIDEASWDPALFDRVRIEVYDGTTLKGTGVVRTEDADATGDFDN
jgi:hypothetical protein